MTRTVSLAAVILDVDGTMYAQRPVQLSMMLRLAAFVSRRPIEGMRCVRALRAYRHAQETLRSAPDAGTHAGRMQYQLAATRTGTSTEDVRSHVARWMEELPLEAVGRAARPGLRDFLLAARQRDLRVGVFSDYPAEKKLRALGVHDLVDIARSAHDSDVGCFKPDPTGLTMVAAELGVSPGECTYIGDRPAVDGVAAQRAGMRAVIIGSDAGRTPGPWEFVGDFAALTSMLLPDPAPASAGGGQAAAEQLLQSDKGT